MNQLLKIKDLHVTIEDKQVLKGVDLTLNKGEIHAIMGPNGSGKSSLSYTIMGHPRYEITQGEILFNKKSINELAPDKRAKEGIFLAMQHPHEVEGIPYKDFLRQAYNALYDGTDKQLRIKEFNLMLLDKLNMLKMDRSFANRSINVGFSGGEKKRAEVLQLATLQPKLAILDEIDSGLDVDALRIVCKGINQVKNDNPDLTILLITHYQRILEYLKPDVVHVMQDGKIIKTGDAQLALEVEKEGYE